MTKKSQTPETDILVESKGKIETFFDKFGSKVMWGLVAVTVIAVGIFIWNNYSDSKQEQLNIDAEAKFIATQNKYPFGLTTNYTEAAEAYLAIANEYEEAAITPICYFVAASSYLQAYSTSLDATDLENAKAAIAKFTKVEGEFGKHINAMALTLEGDIAVEEKDYATAAERFESVLAASTNSDIYGMNAVKLGLTYEAQGKDAEAQEVYKKATEKYPVLEAKMKAYIK